MNVRNQSLVARVSMAVTNSSYSNIDFVIVGTIYVVLCSSRLSH